MFLQGETVKQEIDIFEDDFTEIDRHNTNKQEHQKQDSFIKETHAPEQHFDDEAGLFDENLGFDDYGDVGGASTMEKHGDLLKELTNFDKFIREKTIGWLGMRWDESQNKYVNDPNVEPVMNKRCAAWCIDTMKTYTRANNIITDIGKAEYSFIMSDLITAVWIGIGTRMDEFEIRDLADLYRICMELEHAAALVLMGAEAGKYNKLLSTTTHRTESASYTPQQMGMMQGYSMQPNKKPGILARTRKAIFGA